MVGKEAASLNALSRCISYVTREQQHVSWLNFPGEPHEDAAIKNERCIGEKKNW